MKEFVGLLYNELVKISKKPRSYIGFIALTVICSMLMIGFYNDGSDLIKMVTGQMDSQLQMDGKVVNGNLICYIMLQMLIVQLPLLVSLVTGDLISGETQSGSLRYLLAQKQSRTKIFFAKWFAGIIYTIVLLAWLGIFALVLPRLIFGSGDVVAAFSDNITITNVAQTNIKFIQAFGIATIALTLVASFGFMLSAFLDNSVAPIVIVMATIIVFTILGTLSIPFFDKLSPFLFTSHMVCWRNLFEQDYPTYEIVKSVWILVGHIVLFTSVGLIHFKRKDISC